MLLRMEIRTTRQKEDFKMTEYRSGSVVELDIHGETEYSAMQQLTRWLSRAPADVREVRVIHGCHGCTVLRDMVRRKLKHPRIASKLIALNPGDTRLILKDSQKTGGKHGIR